MGVDLGTGSGAIALSLATEGGALCPGLEVWATDSSADALAVARENLEPSAGRIRRPPAVRLVGGSWFDALPAELPGRIDLLVSNPPYVAESEFADLDPVVRDWEPRDALVAGPGRGEWRAWPPSRRSSPAPPAGCGPPEPWSIEIAPSQAAPAVAAARKAGFGRVATRADLAGRVRMLVARAVTAMPSPAAAPETRNGRPPALRGGGGGHAHRHGLRAGRRPFLADAVARLFWSRNGRGTCPCRSWSPLGAGGDGGRAAGRSGRSWPSGTGRVR